MHFSLSLLLSASLLLIPGTSFYAENTGEFPISPTLLLVSLVILTLLLTALLTGCLALFNKSGTALRILSGLIVGVSAALLIQGTFFVWDFGPLDGRGVRWDDWDRETAIELGTWGLLIALFAFLGVRKPEFVSRIKSLLLLICLSFFVLTLTKLDFTAQETSPHEPLESPFMFHPSVNKILIVLDTMQADIFGEILQQHPQELAFLEGFTFYPDTVGGYPTTRVSVPLMLTGKFYRNQMSVNKWVEENVLGQTLIDILEDDGFGTSIVLNAAPKKGISQPSAYMSLVRYSDWHKFRTLFFPVVDAGLFRAAPTIVKPHIYQDGNWLLSRIFEDPREPPGDHRYDLHFRRAMEQDFSLRSQNAGEFKYFHFRGAHKPLQINERFEYDSQLPDNRDSFVLQSRGVLFNVEKFLQPLKQAGIYADAEILIVGDHGSLSIKANDYRNADNPGADFYGKVLSSARPLFLYKPAGSTKKLAVSDKAVHLADVACTLSDSPLLCTEDSQPVGAADKQRVRKFYYYKWVGGKGFWYAETMPPMTEYIITGDVRDLQSWSVGVKEPEES